MWTMKWPWTSRPDPAPALGVDGTPTQAPWAYWPDRSGALVFEPGAVRYEAAAEPGYEGTDQAAAVWDLWPVRTAHFQAAVDHAPTGADSAADSVAAEAWAARVADATEAMDERDPGGMQAWRQVHADTDTPHLFEARLVAAWESIRAIEDEDLAAYEASKAEHDAETAAYAEAQAREEVWGAVDDDDSWDLQNTDATEYPS
jgi:hypothetical protein